MNIDPGFPNLRVTVDPAALTAARRAAKATVGYGETRKGYVVPRKSGPESVDAAVSRLIEDMIDVGLVPDSIYAKALRAVTWPSGSFCSRNSYALWKTFRVAGMTYPAVEVEGQCPYDHVEVLREYAAASQGAFVPEAAFQATKDINTQGDFDDTSYPILVQFIADEHLYRFRVQQLGFIHDGSAQGVVNRALAERGEPRRFIQIDVHDLGGDVFAVPGLLSDFCAKYDIHIYGHEVAKARRVKTLPSIWNEWNELMKRRGAKSPSVRHG